MSDVIDFAQIFTRPRTCFCLVRQPAMGLLVFSYLATTSRGAVNPSVGGSAQLVRLRVAVHCSW